MTNQINSPLQDSQLKWWQGLDRYCWTVLIIAALGWLFDTMAQNVFNLIRGASLEAVLANQYAAKGIAITEQALKAEAKSTGGLLTSIFLLGWAAGGFVFGVIGDRIGRAKTMILTILIYAVFTALNGLTTSSWQWYAVMRFMTALGVGGEFAAGAALVAEVFPQRSRTMALGSLQALSAVGNMLACFITLSLGDLKAHWTWAFFICGAPALLIFWIMKSVKEPKQWQEAKASALMNKELGKIGDIFTNPLMRRNMIVALLMATAGVGGLWGVGFFSTDMLRGELTKANWSETSMGRAISTMFLIQQVGAFFGIYLFAVLADKVTRRAAFTLWFIIAWISILAYFWGLQGSGGHAFIRALFLAPVLGFCTLGIFAGYSIYFPELFPTRCRATGCGFGYNAARIFAAAAPLALGSLGGKFGFAQAATVVSFVYIFGFIGVLIGPETKGKPLPEDKDFAVPGQRGFEVVMQESK